MSRTRKKKRRSAAAAGIPFLAVVLVAGVCAFLILKYMPTSKTADLDIYYGAPAEGEAAIILGSEIMEDRAKVSGEDIYLPLDFVNRYLNKAYYLDEDNHEILYATPSSLTRQACESQPGREVWETEGEVWLRLDYVRLHTDLDAAVFQEPARIAIQKDFTDLTMVRTMAKGKIRLLGGIKSRVLTTVESGTDLLLLDELDDWSHVATWDGYIGYIEKKKLNPSSTVTLDRTFSDEKYGYLKLKAPVNLVWHNITVQEANENFLSDTASMTGVNVVSPTWFAVQDEYGSFTDLSSTRYVQDAHSKGIQVWGLVDNFAPGFSSFDLLSHTSSRQTLISSLIDAALRVGIDGINIDFESLQEETIPHFLEFLRELSIETHKNGLVLSVDSPVPENYTVYYDRKEQAKPVDYLIMMGYDEHYYGSEEAGSVASLPWVEQGIIDTLKEVPAGRTILGVPFYTRLWWTQAGTLYTSALGMREAAATVAAADATNYWNTELLQNVAYWEQDDIQYQIWLEDEESMAQRMNIVEKYGLGGVAAWRLGFEVPEIWNVISDHLMRMSEGG